MAKSKVYQMSSVDDLFNLNEPVDSSKEQVTEISINELFSFKNHPYKVIDDEKMQDLVESIKEFGILNPVLVRPREEGGYELVSGHRRKHACEILKIDKIPCIVREMEDEEAIILMVDSNIQREELLYSEKAFAYKMKLDAIKRRVGRHSKSDAKSGKEKKSLEVIAENSVDSKNTIHRYIRLTELSSDFLEMVDMKKLPFGVAVEISYLTKADQKILLEVMNSLNILPNLKQASLIKELSQNKKFSKLELEKIFIKQKPKKEDFRLNRNKIDKYFPSKYSEKQKEDIIYKLLEEWSKTNKGK